MAIMTHSWEVQPAVEQDKCRVTLTRAFDDARLSMEIGCSALQLRKGLDMWHQGHLVQHAFPFLTPDEREFLMTGLTPLEWEELSEDGDV